LSLLTRFRRPETEDEPAADAVAVPAAGTEDAAPEPGTEATTDAESRAEAADGQVKRRGKVRGGILIVLTVLAAIFVLFALTVPDNYGQLHAKSFLRIPLEALVAVVVLLVLPRPVRRVVAVLLGVLLGLLTIIKVIDIGFTASLARPFDLVLDWFLLGSAAGVVQDSIGTFGAILAVIGAFLLVIAILTLMVLSMLRLTTLVVRHNRVAVGATALLTVAWIACAAFGAQVVHGVPVASRADEQLVVNRAQQIRTGLNDKDAFQQEAAVDPFKDTPANELFTGLKGKDVVLTFVESYGRYAVEDPTFAPPVDAQLDAGTKSLEAAGFAARSGWISSSTVGGGSWLAHASMLSGLYINNQQRYRSLTSGNRLTLTSAFKKAGWHTVSTEPVIDRAWPEGQFYGYETEYNLNNLGYKGPHFSYATMPDQYTYQQFQQRSMQPGHAPLFAEITTVSSHSPWTPIPKMVDWDKLGDGSIFNDPANQAGGAPGSIIGDPNKLRASYIGSIQYSLNALISYIETYGDKNLVLIFLGDHQPAPVVTGQDASRDVPITIVAKDPAVLDKISSWDWTDGLRPAPNAPEWRMDAFRNNFMTAFGSTPSTH
jgi:hypothetical protein